MLKTIALAFDVYRNKAYVDYIKENVKDKIVVDCGSGSGIWTWVSLYYGAKHVYCLDIHRPTLAHLNLLYKDNPKVSVIGLDLFKNYLPKGDIYLHELFGVNPFGEAIINFLRNCKRQNITNIFPNQLRLFSLEDPVTEIINAEFDHNLLDISNRSFINHLSNSYHEEIDVSTFKELMTSCKFSCTSKTKIWEGNLFEVLDSPNLNIKGDAISWEAGSENYFYSSLNEYYNSWPLGYMDAKAFKTAYLKFLRLHYLNARDKICTASLGKASHDLDHVRSVLYSRG